MGLFNVIRTVKFLLKKYPFWGVLSLRILTLCLPHSFYAVLWREIVSFALSEFSSSGSFNKEKIWSVFNNRSVREKWVDGGPVYKWSEPFCCYLGRYASKNDLKWINRSVFLGVRTPSGNGFLCSALNNDNTEALEWASENGMNFNILAHNQTPLLAFLITHKTPFHPYVDLFLRSGASLDFSGENGISAHQVIRSKSHWLAEWEKRELKKNIHSHCQLSVSSSPRRRM